MAHTRDYDTAYEAIPADSDDAGDGATRIRQFKADVRERLELDHIMDSSLDTSDADADGFHKKVSLREQSSAPTALADQLILYSKNNGGHSEICMVSDTSPAGILMPVGSILMWGGTAAPSGWLLCNGDEVDRTTYASLFQVIGTVFGSGHAGTTFNLPDMVGRVPVGRDTLSTRITSGNAVAINDSSGAETVALSVGELPSHSHTYDAGIAGGVGIVAVAGSVVGPVTTASTGSGAAHNNMPPYLVLNFIIKY